MQINYEAELDRVLDMAEQALLDVDFENRKLKGLAGLVGLRNAVRFHRGHNACMVSKTGELKMLSHVDSIEGHGYKAPVEADAERKCPYCKNPWNIEEGDCVCGAYISTA